MARGTAFRGKAGTAPGILCDCGAGKGGGHHGRRQQGLPHQRRYVMR
jgi:hypothetical protein